MEVNGVDHGRLTEKTCLIGGLHKRSVCYNCDPIAPRCMLRSTLSLIFQPMKNQSGTNENGEH